MPYCKIFVFYLVYAITESTFLVCLISVSIVMGIPTVKRKVKSYLTETLHSLIDKLSPEEKLDCVMVVFIGEVKSLTFFNTISNLPLITSNTPFWNWWGSAFSSRCRQMTLSFQEKESISLGFLRYNPEEPSFFCLSGNGGHGFSGVVVLQILCLYLVAKMCYSCNVRVMAKELCCRGGFLPFSLCCCLVLCQMSAAVGDVRHRLLLN